MIKDLKSLSKVIDLCRKKGVESFEIEGIKINLRAEVPVKKKISSTTETASDDGFPTMEQLLHWSVGPLPGEGSIGENNQ